LRILVAEDEPNILLIYKLYLASEGHEVTATSNGEECLHQYLLSDDQHKPFDVVILDYRMPKMDGHDVAKEILCKHPGQTIIMITAYSKQLIDFSGIEEGIIILQKPFELEELTRLLIQLFEQKGKHLAIAHKDI
jgi:two-component system cell cycle response regulator CpdR